MRSALGSRVAILTASTFGSGSRTIAASGSGPNLDAVHSATDKADQEEAQKRIDPMAADEILSEDYRLGEVGGMRTLFVRGAAWLGRTRAGQWLLDRLGVAAGAAGATGAAAPKVIEIGDEAFDITVHLAQQMARRGIDLGQVQATVTAGVATGQTFAYRWYGQLRTAYYDAGTNIFVATDPAHRLVRTVFSPEKGQAYVDQLRRTMGI